MKKLVLVIAVIAITAASLQAQDHMASKSSKISIGVDAGIPVGTLSTSVYSFMIGGSIQGEFKIAPELALTLSAGYQSWQGKKGLGSSGFVPVLGGIKYYFSPKVYGSGQLGITFSTSSGGGSAFTYAPGIGYEISKNIDVLVKYTGMSFSGGGSLNNAGIRLAYTF